MTKQKQSVAVSLEEGAEFTIGDQSFVVRNGEPIRTTINDVRERSYRIVIPELGIDETLGYWDIDPEYKFLDSELMCVPEVIRGIIEHEFNGSVILWALDWGLLDELEANLDSQDIFIQEMNEDGTILSESGGKSEQ